MLLHNLLVWPRRISDGFLRILSQRRPAVALSDAEFRQACRDGKVDAVRQALPTANLNPTHVDTPLMIAVQHHRVEVAKLLLAGSDLRQTHGFYQETPLMRAVTVVGKYASVARTATQIKETFDVSMIDLLVPGSDLTQQDVQGRSPLLRAFEQTGAVRSLVERLLPGSDAHQQDKHGKNALMHALSKGAWWSVDQLLPLSDPNQVDKHGKSALLYAIEQKHARSVAALLNPTTVALLDSDSNTPLMWAAQRHEPIIFTLVLAASSPELIQHTNPQGCTALMVAAGAGNVEAVTALMGRCDLSQTDDSGRDAKRIAQDEGYDRVVTILVAQEAQQLHEVASEAAITWASSNEPQPTARRRL